MIQAITNQQVGLNVITELIIGYALPGKPIAMMMFKTWGYIAMAQGLTFTSDFKLGELCLCFPSIQISDCFLSGHYMKIAPRSMFMAQVVASIFSLTTQLGVQAWMFTNIEGEWDEVMDVVKRATEAVGRYGTRVSLVLKADIRPGRTGELDGKVERLEQALGQHAS